MVLTPAHQWPTGVVLSPARRHALASWAEDTDAGSSRTTTTRSSATTTTRSARCRAWLPSGSILVGTVSKSLAPALRLGWLVCPADLVEAVGELKKLADRGSPALDQLALARLIESGRFDRHLRLMRRIYWPAATPSVEALAAYAPAVRLSAGWPPGSTRSPNCRPALDESALVAAAPPECRWFYGMSAQRSTGDEEPAQLVLGFGTLGERAIRTGIASVATVLAG